MAETLSKAELRKAHVTGQHPHWTAGCDTCERRHAKGRESAVREFHDRLAGLRLQRDDLNAERGETYAYRVVLIAHYPTLRATLIEGYDLPIYTIDLGYREVVD